MSVSQAKAEAAPRFVALDGLRFVAALVVVAVHVLGLYGYEALTPHAWLAVDFFFALSGFVLDRAYRDKASRPGGFWAVARLRVIRLAPLFYLATVMGVVVYFARVGGDLTLAMVALLGLSVLFSLLFLPSPVALPIGGADGLFPLNVPAWSLSCEMAINLVYAAVARHLTVWRIVAIVAVSAIGMGMLVGDLGGLVGGQNADTWYSGYVRVTFSFFVGVLLGRIVQGRSIGSPLMVFWPLALVLLVVFIMPMGSWTWAWHLVGAFFVFPAVIWLGARASSPSKSPLLSWLGDISYPVYILHWPIMRAVNFVVEKVVPAEIAPAASLVATIAATVIASGLALHFFDKPVRAWLARLGRPRLPATA
jgi:peptidoglycan/LPS O-acetylase OafA/YrhL